jgi:hypothetical protein
MILLLVPLALAAPWVPRTGDVVLQTSASPQSQALQLATDSPWTHTGLVFVRDGGVVVVEAVEPVRVVPLESWLDRGVDDRVVILRLGNLDPLDATGEARLWAAASQLVGRRYDPWFSWDDDRIYCSELVWKVYADALDLRLVEPRTLGSWNLSHPEVQALVSERYPSGLPVDEPAVSPSQLLESRLLQVVYVR